MSSFFKSKNKSVSPQFDVVRDDFKDLRNKTKGVLEQKVGQPGPKFTGETVAPLSEFEEGSLEKLRTFGEKEPQKRGLNVAREEIDRIFSGAEDPTASPTFQALKAAAERTGKERSEAIDRKFATKSGRFQSGARLEAQSDSATDTNIALDQLLASIIERNEDRRLSAIPLSAGLDQAETQADLAPIEALQTFGALPRNLRQAADDAAREEFNISEREYPLNILQLSSALAGKDPILAQRGIQRSSSPFSKLLSIAAPFTGASKAFA